MGWLVCRLVESAYDMVKTFSKNDIGLGPQAIGMAAEKSTVYVVTNLEGFYMRASTSYANGVYTKTIQGLASVAEEGTSIIKLVKSLESEALEFGASKIEINGVDIVETKLLNKEMAERLGYSYEQTSSNSIRLTKTLGKN